MSLYETIVIARQEISHSQVESLTADFTAILAAQGGKVVSSEYWGLRTIAFRIKKNRKGHYTLLNIDAPSAAVIELERNMRINEDILRFMTIRVDALEDGPSAMVQSKSRGRDGEAFGDDEGHGRRGGFDNRLEGASE